MIRLQTPVNDEKCRSGISLSDKIMMLGSCFSDNIGRQLQDFGFDAMVNPFGTLYNHISILNSIRRLVSGTEFTAEDCIDMGAGSGLICSFAHHTSFARKEEATFIENANRTLGQARAYFLECNKLIITLGTSWCFRHMERDMIVSNCLKRPGGEFRRERLSVNDTVEALKEIIGICMDGRGGKKKDIIFTVSPIRHFKDGAHGNQLSKSTLLLGIDEVISLLTEDSAKMEADREKEGISIDYFPAYEIVMDELRDYRFYAEDMCHPSSQTVDYIRERFLDWALPKEEHPQLEENIRNYRRSCHRTLNAE
jgi:hypothetical protein